MESQSSRSEVETTRPGKESARRAAPRTSRARAAAREAEERAQVARGGKKASKINPGLRALVEFLRTSAHHFSGLPE